MPLAVPDARVVEAALDAVPGVAGTSVMLDAAGGELRLVLAPGADEAVVAPLVHRLLRERFGLGLDPDRLSVVEETAPELAPAHLRLVRGPTPTPPTLSAPDLVAPPRLAAEVRESAGRHPAGLSRVGGRVTLGRLAVATDGLGASVTVTLLLDGAPLEASAHAASTTSAVLRAVAESTVEAVGQACGDEVRLDLEAIRLVALGEQEVAVVAVLWVTSEGVERCIGSSEVREDPRQAVIRATLDAVNRRLALA